MSQIRFLCDECGSHHVLAYLRSVEPAIEVLAVGEVGAPPKQTPDPDVYRAAVGLARTLVSGDRTTMSQTVNGDVAAGGHHFGVVFLKPKHSVASYGGTLHLIWFCETAEEWIDRIDYIPY